MERDAVGQFAQTHADDVQVIGMGTQDDFGFAQEFVDSGALTDTPTTFLWEPGFGTWRAFEVSRNSTMALVSPDLSTVGPLFVGFSGTQQQEVLAALADFG